MFSRVLLLFYFSVFSLKSLSKNLEYIKIPFKIFLVDSLMPFQGCDLEDWYHDATITSWDTKAYKSYIFNGMAVRILFPKGYHEDSASTTKYPLLVYFHGYGARGPVTNNEDQLLVEGEFFKNMVEKGDYKGIVLVPQNQDGWTSRYEESVYQCIRFLIHFKKADPYRVIMRGYSNGADLAWRMVSKHPELIASTICLSGIVNETDIPPHVFREVNIWLLQGLKDQQLLPNASRSFVKSIHSKLLPLKYTIVPNAGHELSKQNQQGKELLPFLNSSNKLNPILSYIKKNGKNSYPILSISNGFSGYQWRRNSINIPNNDTNTLRIKSAGRYEVRVRNYGEWSYWSPNPILISTKNIH
jgi:large repetitive protein